MVTRKALTTYLDGLLRLPPGGHDSSNNGLQVEGRAAVRRIVFGVDACLALFECAAKAGADFIVVHHGLSWGDNQRYLTGCRARRLEALFANGISLYASHLPLDAHPDIGHNAVIARRLGLSRVRPFFPYGSMDIGRCGDLPKPLPLHRLKQKVDEALNTETDVLRAGSPVARRVGVVSGGGADAVEACVQQGCDCLVTGEYGHQHYHAVMELGVNVLAAGHYRSEMPGLEALMARLQARFKVPCEFIDLPTGL